jgi:hypothetical protein
MADQKEYPLYCQLGTSHLFLLLELEDPYLYMA